jgi:hypothetical protein
VLASAPGRLPFRLRPGAGICATFGHMKRLYAQRRDLLRVGLGEDFGIEAMESSALRARATGEVCLTAVETGLTGRFRIKIVRNQKLTTPHAETPTHLIAMAFDEDMENAVRKAVRIGDPHDHGTRGPER